MIDLDDLIAEAREAAVRSALWDIPHLLFRLADALEAATRVPVQGEPNGDREALIREALEQVREIAEAGRAGEPLRSIPKDADPNWGWLQTMWPVAVAVDVVLSRATVPDAATEAKQPEGWSTEDRREAKCEAERRWSRPVMREAEQRYQAGCINGFILGAEWQKARETFISYKAIADQARAERDAALAAIERVRAEANAYAEQPDVMEPCGAAAQSILAALDGAPEPEEKQ